MVDIGAGNRRCNRTGVMSRLDTEVLEKVAPLASSILRKVGIRIFKKKKKNIRIQHWMQGLEAAELNYFIFLYILLSDLFLFLSGVSVSPPSMLLFRLWSGFLVAL